MAEDNAKRAMADAARLAEELRHEQEHAGQIERLRRALESQVTSPLSHMFSKNGSLKAGSDKHKIILNKHNYKTREQKITKS